MTSHLIKPFKFFLKPSLGNLIIKPRMSTEMSKLPGNYKMAHHTEYYAAEDVPAELVAVMLNRKDLEMFMSLEEKNGQWNYKTEHFVKGVPVGGNEYTFKVGEKFKLAGNDPTDPKNFGKVMEVSVESVEDSLVLKGQDETMTLTPLTNQGMISITREVKGENNPTHKMYFEKVVAVTEPVNKDSNINKESDKEPHQTQHTFFSNFSFGSYLLGLFLGPKF